MNLQHTVFILGVDLGPVSIFRKRKAPHETAVGALNPVVLLALLFLLVMTYSLSSSEISTNGAHSATEMASFLSPPAGVEVRPKYPESRFSISSSSLKGFHLVVGSHRVSPLMTIASLCVVMSTDTGLYNVMPRLL